MSEQGKKTLISFDFFKNMEWFLLRLKCFVNEYIKARTKIKAVQMIGLAVLDEKTMLHKLVQEFFFLK